MRRDVSFIDEDVKRWIEEEGPEDGLCLKRFRADITVSNLHKCKVGDVVEISESLYEITETGKDVLMNAGCLKGWERAVLWLAAQHLEKELKGIKYERSVWKRDRLYKNFCN